MGDSDFNEEKHGLLHRKQRNDGIWGLLKNFNVLPRFVVAQRGEVLAMTKNMGTRNDGTLQSQVI
jgi:hypothetical protein